MGEGVARRRGERVTLWAKEESGDAPGEWAGRWVWPGALGLP